MKEPVITTPITTSANPYPWSKEARHFGILWGTEIGQLFSWPLVDETDVYDAEAGVIAGAVGATIGVLVVVGQVIYKRIKKIKKNQKSSSDDEQILVTKQKKPLLREDKNNVMHNRAKAGATSGAGFGCLIGAALGEALPIPMAEKLLMLLGSAIGGTLGGLIAILIPSWVPPKATEPQANPASERIRSGAMLGVCVGIVFGAFVLTTLTPFGVPVCILLGTGLGITLFSISAYFLDESYFREDPNASNPWAKRIRAGVQWGACLGMLVGVLLPGLGIGLNAMLSVVVGSALFSIGGCIVALAVEPVINKILALCGKKYETVNPWGPRARCGSFYGTWVGTLIGCCIFPGFIGATLGGAIGGIIGGLVAVLAEPIYIAVMTYWRGENYTKIIKEEELASCPSGNQWSERCRTGTQIGAALGALIGFFAFPPFGIFFGGAIGGILGGALAYFIPADWNHKDMPDDAQEAYSSIQYAHTDSVEMNPLLNSQSSLIFSDIIPSKNLSVNNNIDYRFTQN